MVSSRVYPGLERKPGGPDNWVERAGGLPSYIERIAKHLHYEKGMTISRAIASAVNTVKRWARMGKVAKYGDPNHKHVNPKTAALAAAAVAEWEAKRAAGKINLSDVEEFIIDLTDLSDDFCLELAEELENVDLSKYDSMGTGVDLTAHAILSSMNVQDLALRANKITDPEARGAARQRVLDLADFNAKQRSQAASKGQAMEGGGFPIRNEQDLKNAIRAVGRASNPGAAKRHIIKRARALGLLNLVPDQWTVDLTEALGEVLDLASTIAPRNARGRASDGRRSYKGQGKYKHGFIPVNRAAKEAKAKGSPIAIKRLNRLFGPNKVPDDPRKNTREVQVSRGGRVGNRQGTGKSNRAAKDVRVNEKSNPSSEHANSVAFFRHQDTNNKNVAPTKNNVLPASQKEASKASRIPARAKQNWDEIPDSLKTVRNGKKYVLAEFGGRGYLTEWVGGVQQVSQTSLAKRKVMRTLASADAANMSHSELRGLINNPQTPAQVKRTARKALKSALKGNPNA